MVPTQSACRYSLLSVIGALALCCASSFATGQERLPWQKPDPNTYQRDTYGQRYGGRAGSVDPSTRAPDPYARRAPAEPYAPDYGPRPEPRVYQRPVPVPPSPRERDRDFAQPRGYDTRPVPRVPTPPPQYERFGARQAPYPPRNGYDARPPVPRDRYSYSENEPG